MKLAVAAVVIALTFHDAGAISACSGQSGWASNGAEVAQSASPTIARAEPGHGWARAG